MQKWIYTMSPRKPFSMQRKGSYTVVPTYQRNFNLQSSKNKGSYNFGIVLLLIMSFVIVFAISSWRNYEKEKHQQEITFAKSQEDRTFNFLIDSGKYRLLNGRISGAYSEFKLAKAIRPNDIELKNYLQRL